MNPSIQERIEQEAERYAQQFYGTNINAKPFIAGAKFYEETILPEIMKGWDISPIDYSKLNNEKVIAIIPIDTESTHLPPKCKDKKRGKNDECRYPVGSCQLCQQ